MSDAGELNPDVWKAYYEEHGGDVWKACFEDHDEYEKHGDCLPPDCTVGQTVVLCTPFYGMINDGNYPVGTISKVSETGTVHVGFWFPLSERLNFERDDQWFHYTHLAPISEEAAIMSILAGGYRISK